MKRSILIGVLAGLTTGALWGLTFVAPRAVQPFTVYDLAIARYLIFGIASALLMVHPAFRPRGIPPREIGLAILLGSAGYIGYFLAIAFAVRYAGAAIPPLVIGLLPVALALIGNWREQTVDFTALAFPLVLITAGVLAVNGWTFASASDGGDRFAIALGVGFSLVALLIWVFYGVLNARILQRPDAPSSLQWAGLQGLGAGLGTLPLAALVVCFGGSALPHLALTSMEGIRFLVWALVMGIAGSWIATWCWSVASTHLPLALSAQLIVAETIFGLAYGFWFEARWPHALELAGAALQIIGVAMAIYVFHSGRKPAVFEPSAMSESMKNVSA